MIQSKKCRIIFDTITGYKTKIVAKYLIQSQNTKQSKMLRNICYNHRIQSKTCGVIFDTITGYKTKNVA